MVQLARRTKLIQLCLIAAAALVASLVLVKSGGANAAAVKPGDCGSLASQTIAGAQITSAVAEPAGSITISGQTYSGLPAFCRVSAVTNTTVNFEVWLPATSWSGDLESVGNGGYAGTIDYADMATALTQGYVTASTDTGHLASDLTNSFIGNAITLSEWGHYSIHLMTLPTKAIIAAYYRSSVKYSYFVGGSTGGDQAMEEAEFFPSDYNGIVARSPGMDYSHLMMSFIHTALPTAENPAAYIGTSQATALNNAVLKACAAEKAAPTDNFLTQPQTCYYNPVNLQCPENATNTSSCLTQAQVANADNMYAPVTDPADGRILYPGFNHGTEAEWSSLQTSNGNSLAQTYAQQLFGIAVYNNTNWPLSSFNFDSGEAAVDAALSPSIDATSPDLRAFEADGGKLIMTQGWDDPLNAAGLPIEYYDEELLTAGGLENGSNLSAGAETSALAKVQTFFRLFMQPGVGHVTGGPGPDSWDPISVIRAWAEQGKAPDSIMAAKMQTQNGVTATAETRPYCPYPAVVTYRGRGDTSVASSFYCKGNPLELSRDIASEQKNIRESVGAGDLANLPN